MLHYYNLGRRGSEYAVATADIVATCTGGGGGERVKGLQAGRETSSVFTSRQLSQPEACGNFGIIKRINLPKQRLCVVVREEGSTCFRSAYAGKHMSGFIFWSNGVNNSFSNNILMQVKRRREEKRRGVDFTV